MATQKVLVCKARYISLLNDSNKLGCLEGGGVDNWCGYSESLYPDDKEYAYKEVIDVVANDDLTPVYEEE